MYTAIRRIEKGKVLRDKYFATEALERRWSLEALGEEDEINKESEYDSDVEETEGDNFSQDDDGFFEDNNVNEGEVQEEVPSIEEEDNHGMDELGDMDADVTLESDAKEVTNLMEVSGVLMNTYYKNMSGVFTSNPKLIDYTGDIRENPLYEKFIEPAKKIILMYSNETQLQKKIENYFAVICNKKAMTAVTGKKESPFIYEAIQLLTIESLRELLAVMPVAIQNGLSIEDAIEKYGYKHISQLVEALVDVTEVSVMFGDKIYYMEPDEQKEISGTNEAINATPYANNAAFESIRDNYDFTLKTFSATESIMNIIEIRNNKALMEFTLLMKLCIFVSGLCKDVKFNESCMDVLNKVQTLLTKDTTGGEEEIKEAVAAIVSSCREEVIMPQLNKLGEVQDQTNNEIDNA